MKLNQNIPSTAMETVTRTLPSYMSRVSSEYSMKSFAEAMHNEVGDTTVLQYKEAVSSAKETEVSSMFKEVASDVVDSMNRLFGPSRVICNGELCCANTPPCCDGLSADNSVATQSSSVFPLKTIIPVHNRGIRRDGTIDRSYRGQNQRSSNIGYLNEPNFTLSALTEETEETNSLPSVIKRIQQYHEDSSLTDVEYTRYDMNTTLPREQDETHKEFIMRLAKERVMRRKKSDFPYINKPVSKKNAAAYSRLSRKKSFEDFRRKRTERYYKTIE